MKGLKTGMYYLRSRAAADAIKFTVDTSTLKVNDHLHFLLPFLPWTNCIDFLLLVTVNLLLFLSGKSRRI